MAGYPGMKSRYIYGIQEKNILNTVKNRFYSKVSLPNQDGCLEWLAGKTNSGYGLFYEEKKFITAHRFSYKLIYGEIPEGNCVLHKCDNRKCINPDHLFLGTLDINNKDRATKKRSATNYGGAKLSFKKADEIRNKINNGSTPYELADLYKVVPETIYNIINNKTWRNI